jgi:hypothetical protein
MTGALASARHPGQAHARAGSQLLPYARQCRQITARSTPFEDGRLW